MTTTAVIIVERSVDVAFGTRAETSARFVRIPARTSTHEALRTIGAAVDLPAPSTCASISTLASESPAQAAPVIELADVGAVSLQANGRETRLLPRQLPDVTDVVSGVVYARAAEPALIPSAVRYVVRATGGPDGDGFSATATAPADPSDVHVTGEEGSSGLTVAAGMAIELTWSGDGTDDVLYVDVQPAAFRCTLSEGPTTAEDRSRATVSASLIDEAGTLVVHRLHREALVAGGIEAGEIRFDFSRLISYARR